MTAKEEKRCERCGWPIVPEGEAGCWESNCSMRPMPDNPQLVRPREDGWYAGEPPPDHGHLLAQAWELSTWAGSINWRGGENQPEWLEELRVKIEVFQAGYKQLQPRTKGRAKEEA